MAAARAGLFSSPIGALHHQVGSALARHKRVIATALRRVVDVVIIGKFASELGNLSQNSHALPQFGLVHNSVAIDEPAFRPTAGRVNCTTTGFRDKSQMAHDFGRTGGRNPGRDRHGLRTAAGSSICQIGRSYVDQPEQQASRKSLRQRPPCRNLHSSQARSPRVRG